MEKISTAQKLIAICILLSSFYLGWLGMEYHALPIETLKVDGHPAFEIHPSESFMNVAERLTNMGAIHSPK